jgi:hypothetical protein
MDYTSYFYLSNQNVFSLFSSPKYQTSHRGEYGGGVPFFFADDDVCDGCFAGGGADGGGCGGGGVAHLSDLHMHLKI